jgi:16S rRNA processing protein RimM
VSLTPDEDPLVPVGVVARPHGVRGELRVHLYNAKSRLLHKIPAVYLMREGKPPELTPVKSARVVDKAALLFIEGINDRNAADTMRGVEIGVPRSSLPPPDEDEVYLVDLVGLEVRGQNGFTGKVTQIFEYPSVVCLEVTSEDGIREVPMLEGFLVEIDVEAGFVELGDISDIPLRS